MRTNGRRRCIGICSLAALFAAAPLDLGFRPAGGIAHFSIAAAKDGDSGHDGSDSGSGNSGSNSGSGNSSDSSDSGSDSEHGGSGDQTEDRAGEDRDSGGKHRNGGDVEVIYPDGWKEVIHDGIFELRDPDGRKVTERRATAADIARMRAFAR